MQAPVIPQEEGKTTQEVSPGFDSHWSRITAQPRLLHTSCPHYYRFGLPGESELEFSQRLADELEQMILAEGPDTVAAFIGEPVASFPRRKDIGRQSSRF